MKDHLLALVRVAPTPGAGLGVAREYLQARILEGLQRAGAMLPLAFHGGTALRFLHGIPRQSEDLDFALERPDRPYDFRGWLDGLEARFRAEGYRVDVKVSDAKAVHGAFVRFRGLPRELGLPAQPDEVLAVKVEVDTRPPAGAVLATTVVTRHVPIQLQHHDRASLFAGKLHAVLSRRYTKGRDLYDLLWYLSTPGWPEPNLGLLNNALAQTGWRAGPLVDGTWQAHIARRLEALDWRRAVDDVRPFLEDPGAAGLLTRANVLRALNTFRQP